MNINLTKQYTTRSGLPVKLYDIVSESAKQTHPVIGAYFEDGVWKSRTWMLNGNYDLSIYETDCEMNLIEIPTHNFVKDQLVLVWNFENETKKIRFLSEYKDGEAITYRYGEQPSYSAHYEHWLNCEPYHPTPESKPLQEGELVVFQMNPDVLYSYAVGRYLRQSERTGNHTVTNVSGTSISNYTTNYCVRLSEFKL